MLDTDLADLYGVTTKRLNEQVRRNRERFPKDFLFQLTETEKAEVVANCDHLTKLKFSPNPPYAFTEHGAIMAASVLNSPSAVEVSVYVVRAFVQLRELARLYSIQVTYEDAAGTTRKASSESLRVALRMRLPEGARLQLSMASGSGISSSAV